MLRFPIFVLAAFAVSSCAITDTQPSGLQQPQFSSAEQQQAEQEFALIWQQYQTLRWQQDPQQRQLSNTTDAVDWPDISAEAQQQQLQDWQRLRQQLSAIEQAALAPQQQWRYDTLLSDLEQRLVLAPFTPLALDLSGPDAWQRRIAQTLMTQHPVERISDVYDYIDRLQGAAELLNRWREQWQQADNGFLPPQAQFDQAIKDINELLTGFPFDANSQQLSPLWVDIRGKIIALELYPSSQRVLLQRTQQALTGDFYSALSALASQLQQTAEHAKDAPALSQHPQGLHYYQLLLSHYSDSHRDAQYWHNKAQQVIQLRQQEWLVGASLSEGQSFSNVLPAQPRLTLTDDAIDQQRQQLQQAAQQLALRIDRPLPALAVTAISTTAQPWSDLLSYQLGELSINPAQLQQLTEAQLSALTVRQGLAQHWLTFGATSAADSTLLASPASQQGWQAYVARLLLYRDPSWRRAVVLAELNDACLAAVDTGLHALGWSPQQAQQFLAQQCNLSEQQQQQWILAIQDQPGRALAALAGLQGWQRLAQKANSSSWLPQLLSQGLQPLDILQQRLTAEY